MNENDTCLIWGTPANLILDRSREGLNVSSPRAGGEYFVNTMAAFLVSKLNDREKARLTTWLIEQRRLGVEKPEISSCKYEMDSIVRRPDLNVYTRADELLKYIQKKTPHIGRAFLASDFLQDMFAYTESVDPEELQYLADYLIGKGWLDNSDEATIALIVTVEGHSRLAELERVVTVSSRAFVAMWFDDSVKETWNRGIEPAIRNSGYHPIRIDNLEFIGKIDDEIIAEIRRSRFMVADFTQGKEGARGGVYYEAGFGHGLGIPVIFTCRKDVIERNLIHFDVRQQNFITWEEHGDLKERLTNRIEAEIGDGPLKTQNLQA